MNGRVFAKRATLRVYGRDSDPAPVIEVDEDLALPVEQYEMAYNCRFLQWISYSMHGIVTDYALFREKT